MEITLALGGGVCMREGTLPGAERNSLLPGLLPSGCTFEQVQLFQGRDFAVRSPATGLHSVWYNQSLSLKLLWVCVVASVEGVFLGYTSLR